MRQDALFSRAERARATSQALTEQLLALRDLRTLERDLRAVVGNLARAISWRSGSATSEEMQRMLEDADRLLLK